MDAHGVGDEAFIILTADATCAHKNGLFRGVCNATATGQCVYCGANFCDQHGTHGEDYYEICSRERCRAKFEDLQAHRVWVQRQYQDNVAGYCALERCQDAPEVGCQRCMLRFCPAHVKAASVTQRQLDQSTEIMMLCLHCVARLRIWED